jgi:hypothetical protein
MATPRLLAASPMRLPTPAAPGRGRARARRPGGSHEAVFEGIRLPGAYLVGRACEELAAAQLLLPRDHVILNHGAAPDTGHVGGAEA